MKARFILALTALTTLAGLACLPAIPRGAAQEKKDPFAALPQPGPEHKMLAAMSGTWEAKVKFWMDPSKPPQESTGTMVKKMILDGRFMQENYKDNGEMFGKPFLGQGLVGYDAPKKKFVMAWADSMSTTLSISHGTYDESAKTITFRGEEEIPGMGKFKTRDVLKIVSTDMQHMEMFREPEGSGKEFKVLEIHYTRKKK